MFEVLVTLHTFSLYYLEFIAKYKKKLAKIITKLYFQHPLKKFIFTKCVEFYFLMFKQPLY